MNDICSDIRQKRRSFCTECNVENNILNYFDLPEKFSGYIQEVLKANLLRMSALLSEVCIVDFERETGQNRISRGESTLLGKLSNNSCFRFVLFRSVFS